MKPLAERLSKKQKRAALVALIAGSLLYILFYPPDIPRPSTITFEGYAPPEAGIIGAVALAKAERDFYFCKRHYLGAEPQDKYKKARGFQKPNSDGHFKIVLDIDQIPLGGLCRYRLYDAMLSYLASPPTPAKPSYSPGSFAAAISIPPRSGPLWTRRTEDSSIKMNKGISAVLNSCCELSNGSLSHCGIVNRTIKSFDKNYTFRVNLKLNPDGCPPTFR